MKTGLKLNPWVQKLNQYKVWFQTDIWRLQNIGIDTGLLRLVMTVKKKLHKRVSDQQLYPPKNALTLFPVPFFQIINVPLLFATLYF